MTHKNLAIVLLFIFLSACAPATQTSEVSETSEVLTPTAILTLTPESTATLTPVPTAPPFQYTSCADSELIEKIQADFVEEIGTGIDEYVRKLLSSGKYETLFYFLSDGKTMSEYVLIGGSEVSLANLTGAHDGDTAFCLYFVDDDISVIVPVVLAYSYEGKFHLTMPIGNDTGNKEGLSPFTSMSELREWWTIRENKISLGDVFKITYYTFSEIDSLDKLDNIDRKDLTKFDNIAKLIHLIGGDYLSRISGGNSPFWAAQELDVSNGDIGVFADVIILQEHNPLSP